MVRITGKSLESLYRYLDGEIGGKAPAGHEHTQAQVAGLPDALNGKAAEKHGHAQADVAGLTAALDKKVDSEAPLLSSTLRDARITTGNQQVANVGPEGDNIYLGNPATTLWLESAHEIQANIAGDVKKLYREGNGVLVKTSANNFSTLSIVIPSTGWIYEPWRDAYYQDFDVQGLTGGTYPILRCEVIGPNCTLLGAFAYDNYLRIWMADVPLMEGQYIWCDFFRIA